MYYDSELNFLRSVLKKMRVQSHILHPQHVLDESLDFGLRRFLDHDEEYVENFRKSMDFYEENTLYKVTDAYFCNYIFLILPGTKRYSSLLLGPYISFEMDETRLMHDMDHFGILASQVKELESYYVHIPVISDDSVLLMMVNTLAEHLWGEGHAYKIVYLNRDTVPFQSSPLERKSQDDSLLQMRLLETRYAYENELMENVSKGLLHRAELMISQSSEDFFEQRISDPLRNQKNYCIICNTLMRKAAEKGGVHPLHLDSVSSDYARKIEMITSTKEGSELMLDMVNVYCRLVLRHSIKDYSPLVQKTVTYIEAELASDLSLSALSSICGVSPGYLSSQFHKETGKTLTAYVNDRRIETGARLLRTTKLPVQMIAEHCGIPDANYFAKVFKKRYEMSPREFREKESIVK